MKKTILIIICLVFMAGFSFAEDSKEVVTLKLEKAFEVQARIRAELQLMQYRFKEGQEALTTIEKEIKEFQGKLKAMEPKKEEKPKVEEKKK